MSKEEKKRAAMDELFSGLTSPSIPSVSPDNEQHVSGRNSSEKIKKYKEENERVCTIMHAETMNKLRYIAAKEGLAIRDLFEVGARFAIKNYESKFGPINVRKSKPKKGDPAQVFDI